MKQYIANTISLSRVFYVIYVLFRYIDKQFLVKFNEISKIPFLISIFACILSDKLDGMAARRFGSTNYGGIIDSCSDRVAIIALYYFIYPKSKRFLALTFMELLMVLWLTLGLWPSQRMTELLHPIFPYHFGRISLTLQAIGGFLMLINRLSNRHNSRLELTGSILLWVGTSITVLALIIYPIMMFARNY